MKNHPAILFFQNGIIHRTIKSVDWHAALGENTDTFICMYGTLPVAFE